MSNPASQEIKQDLSNLIANQIHSAISTKTFFDWYNSGDWDKFISGDENAPSYFEIIEQIKKLFKLE